MEALSVDYCQHVQTCFAMVYASLVCRFLSLFANKFRAGLWKPCLSIQVCASFDCRYLSLFAKIFRVGLWKPWLSIHVITRKHIMWRRMMVCRVVLRLCMWRGIRLVCTWVWSTCSVVCMSLHHSLLREHGFVSLGSVNNIQLRIRQSYSV